MKKKLLVGLATGLFVLLESVGFASATSIVMEVKALIDGRDQLIVDDNTMQWHHFEYDRVGQWQGRNEPTYISIWVDGTQQLANFAWTPIWSGNYSDKFYSSSILSPDKNSTIILDPIVSRGSTTISQTPDISNGYSIVIEFNDNSIGGADWYTTQVGVAYAADHDPSPVPEPATMLLFGTGIASLAGSRIRRKKK